MIIKGYTLTGTCMRTRRKEIKPEHNESERKKRKKKERERIKTRAVEREERKRKDDMYEASHHNHISLNDNRPNFHDFKTTIPKVLTSRPSHH